jgi:F-type H+-transporting ATPase subunit b
MHIDWLTVTAQIVNFLILVWLLKRFLYHPVIDAMDRREQRVAEYLRQAEQREQLAASAEQDFREQEEALTRERAELIEQAREAAAAERSQLVDQVRAEVSEQRARWQRQLDDEQQAFLHNLRQQVAQSVQGIASRTLADLADARLEEQILQQLLRRLESLDEESRRLLAGPGQPLQVATAFALDAPARQQLASALGRELGLKRELVFVEAPELLCGIALSSEGRRLNWAVAEYLESLEQEVSAALEAHRDTNH